ncbi:hypothetical protein K501DRAFT_325535 [Backusella circina FSU 941]|nr:hypothetical protein K501DRAFT_325535 [Backusella circina FSU 941]
MYSTFYKRRRQHQKPHILTIEQSRELGQLAGNKLVRSIIDNGLIPNNLFRLRKRKLEKILSYLSSRGLIHKKIPLLDNIQTHQLATWLLTVIYPGYSVSKAKNQAFTDYRECRERDLGPAPLAYDLVPTTDIFERLDEIYRSDVNWQEESNYDLIGKISIPISYLKKSIDRVCSQYKHEKDVRYHLCLWSSNHILIKPQCNALYFNSENTWLDQDKNIIDEGFMHIDVTSKIRTCFDNYKPFAKKKQPYITIGIELEDNNEQNISHISITAVVEKGTNELVRQLYLQSTTECITRAIQSSSNPIPIQHKAIHLLKQLQDDDVDVGDSVERDEEMLIQNTESSYIKVIESFRDQSSGDEYEEDYQDAAHHPVGIKVNLMDPISHKRIRHPIKSFHCKHRACFDAASFFEHNRHIKIWHCPYCFVQIKSTEELQISFPIKVALNQYPNEERLFVLQEVLLSENEILQEAASRIMANSLKRTHSTANDLLICIDNEDDDVNSITTDEDDEQDNHHVQKRFRTLTHVM